MEESINHVTDEQHNSMLCSPTRFFFFLSPPSFQALHWLPAQLILAEEYDCSEYDG